MVTKGHTSLNKSAVLDAGLLKYLWPFVPPGTKGLSELNICEKKNCEIKVCELDLEKLKIAERLRMRRSLMHLLIYLWTLFYFGIKSHKIEHTFKTHD